MALLFSSRVAPHICSRQARSARARRDAPAAAAGEGLPLPAVWYPVPAAAAAAKRHGVTVQLCSLPTHAEQRGRGVSGCSGRCCASQAKAQHAEQGAHLPGPVRSSQSPPGASLPRQTRQAQLLVSSCGVAGNARRLAAQISKLAWSGPSAAQELHWQGETGLEQVQQRAGHQIPCSHADAAPGSGGRRHPLRHPLQHPCRGARLQRCQRLKRRLQGNTVMNGLGSACAEAGLGSWGSSNRVGLCGGILHSMAAISGGAASDRPTSVQPEVCA